MAKFEKQSYFGTPILLDGNEYTECAFDECEIIHKGGELPKLSQNTFTDCRWRFCGSPEMDIKLTALIYRGCNRVEISAGEVMDSMFPGARLKIKRAQKHITDFNNLAQAFVNSDMCRLRVHRDPQSRHYFLGIEWTKSSPPELPLILGDAIHNLRAALDFAWCDVIRAVGGTTNNYTRMKAFNDRDHLITTLKGGIVKKVPGIIEVMADTIKAYRAGNDNPFMRLHDLDVTDKHDIIIPTFNVAALHGISAYTINPDGTPGMCIRQCSLTVGEGGVLNLAGSDQEFQIQNEGQPAFGVVFRKGQPFEDQAIVPTLHQLAQFVSGVLDALERPLIAYNDGAAA